MQIRLEVANVVANKPKNYFVAVQLQFPNSSQAPLKFRTDLAVASNRPVFKNNIFQLPLTASKQTLKLGLMACPIQQPQNISAASLQGMATIIVDQERIKQLTQQHLHVYSFMRKETAVGQCTCTITVENNGQMSKKGESFKLNQGKSQAQRLNKSQIQGLKKSMAYNPLVSRVLYSQEGTKDQMKMERSIAELQKLSESLYAQFKGIKQEEETLQEIFQGLIRDQEQLRSEIQVCERINHKIGIKIQQKEGLQGLKLQIDMLKNTQQGKGILLQRLHYFDQRLQDELDQFQILSNKYQQLKQDIHARITRAQNYAKKLKGKQLQQFQINKNQQLLRRYEDIHYEFTCNQGLIRSLAQRQSNRQQSDNPLSAQQAQLLLSQVNYHIQLEEIGGGVPQQGQELLRQIQAEAALKAKNHTMSSEQAHVLEIKLGAINQEIAKTRGKLHQTTKMSVSTRADWPTFTK